jgi:cold shock CspA family protein
MSARRMTGTVVAWDEERGYGKVRPDHGGYARIHYRDLPGHHGDLHVGQRVSFIEVRASAGWEAREVAYIDGPPSRAKLGDVASAQLAARRKAMLVPSCNTRDELIANGLLKPAKEAR